jgi:hypothetical protein
LDQVPTAHASASSVNDAAMSRSSGISVVGGSRGEDAARGRDTGDRGHGGDAGKEPAAGAAYRCD